MAELMERVPIQDNPCDVPEILDQIFRLLDHRSLRQARLVCRKWNDCALQILSKNPGRVFLDFDDGYGREACRFERIKKLQSILPFTQYPEMFLSNLELYGGVLIVDTQLFNILQKFGSTLKSLKLSLIKLTLFILRKMLENWCANLEELTLYCITVTEDNNIMTQDFETSSTFLKLKLRKFKVFYGDKTAACRNLMVSIVKNSPKLQVLHVDINQGHDFWGKIQYFPNITKNLEEVKIVRFGITDLSLIEKVSFSNKLTSFTLQMKDPSFPKERLVTLLKRIGDLLEKLYLNIEITIKDQLSYWKIELPLMKKLKFLDLEHSFHSDMSFDSIDFLKNLPNVEIVRLARSDTYRGTIPFKCVNDLFCNAWYLPMHPHTTLHTLFLNGSPKDPETIFAINRMLPNLRDLTLVVEKDEIPDSSWWTRIVTGFTEMKNLKVLHLIFTDSHSWNLETNFETCFRHLEASKSLEELKISLDYFDARSFGFGKSFPPGLEKVIVKVPKLKVLTISSFMMEISEWKKLYQALNQKGILLKEDPKFGF